MANDLPLVDELENAEQIAEDDCPQDMVCSACDEVSDDLSYYDNGIYGHAGWMCGDCIGGAEMEL